MENIGLTICFKDIGVLSSDDKKMIINNLNTQRMSNHPVKVTKDIINRIISS